MTNNFFQLFVGTSEVPVNPSEDHPPSKAPIISIPSDSFSSTNGNLIKSYILYLKVAYTNHYISVNDELDSLGETSIHTTSFTFEIVCSGILCSIIIA